MFDKGRHLGILLVLISASADAIAPGPLTLELRPALIVGASTVRFDQLVSIVGGDAETRAQLARIEVKLSSPPGEVERITREDLSALAALRVPEASGHMEWSGKARFSLVRIEGRPMDLQRFTAQAQTALENWLSQHYSSYSVQAVAGMQQTGPESTADETASIRPVTGPISVRTAVWVDLGRTGQGARRSFPIWFSVQAFTDAPVAASDIASGTRLLPEQIKRINVDVAQLGARPIIDDSDVPGSISLGPIRQGDVLTRDRFRQASPVMAGDEVRVRVQAGALRVEAHGVALETGGTGQRVRVRNSGSGEVLAAYVAGPDLVEVSP